MRTFANGYQCIKKLVYQRFQYLLYVIHISCTRDYIFTYMPTRPSFTARTTFLYANVCSLPSAVRTTIETPGFMMVTKFACSGRISNRPVLFSALTLIPFPSQITLSGLVTATGKADADALPLIMLCVDRQRQLARFGGFSRILYREKTPVGRRRTLLRGCALRPQPSRPA